MDETLRLSEAEKQRWAAIEANLAHDRTTRTAFNAYNDGASAQEHSLIVEKLLADPKVLEDSKCLAMIGGVGVDYIQNVTIAALQKRSERGFRKSSHLVDRELGLVPKNRIAVQLGKVATSWRNFVAALY